MRGCEINRGTVSSDQPSKACGTAFLKGDQQFRQESLIFLRKFFLEVWSGRWLTPLEERPSTAGQDSAIAKLVWQKATCACGFFIDSVSLHQKRHS
jgi:hypothetical protein